MIHRRTWKAPHPNQVADLRLKTLNSYHEPVAVPTLGAAVLTGSATLVPLVNKPTSAATAVAIGQVLADSEVERLTNAHLYYATEDMCALAVAAGQRTPLRPVDATIAPSPYGFMVFEQPIGSYLYSNTTMGLEGQVWVPIVAVSWGPWNSPALTRCARWGHNGPEGLGVIACTPDTQGVWLTFYTPSQFTVGHGDAIMGHINGEKVTAREIADTNRSTFGDITWENETMLGHGGSWGPREDLDAHDASEGATTRVWSQIVYTAWQIMAQTGRSALAETSEVARIRQGRKRDARANVATPGVVRVVNLRNKYRRAKPSGASETTGRGVVNWSCRWEVPPYRRVTCLNPRGHAQGLCKHEEKVVPFHVKGPPDKPLKLSRTVNLWDE